FLSVIIDVEGDEKETFESFESLQDVDRETAEKQLVTSGLWTSFRTRPFSKVPELGSEPNSIFVTAMDTNPLSAEPELIIAENSDDFIAGLNIVTKFTDGKTFLCTRNDSRVPGNKVPDVVMEEFHGPHPAGLPGTHIHFLDPVGPNKTVWHISYQDVIAIGRLFTQGEFMTERVVAVAGPRVKKPGLYRTKLGCCIDHLTAGMIEGDDTRVVSGSVLCGQTIEEPVNFLGRYDYQVSALEEGDKREFLGWQGPGFNKFSVTRIYAGALGLGKLFNMNTNINGSKRSMVPVETYERIMPLDILPTQLLRALITNDTEQAQALGCLELAEEDLALCTYVCPGKYDYGSILRENLTTIEKEG
ncbi:MAG: Na(+)-translocating NADH-quinone reductase subunit A, partial [Planctomycetota bacterium]